jgi:hypothetical protein
MSVHDLDLTMRLAGIVAPEQFHGVIRRITFAQQSQSIHAIIGINQGLGRNGANLAGNEWYERSCCEEPCSDRYA